MKTEDYIVLGVGAFLAYQMVKKDVGEAIDKAVPDVSLPSLPSIDFSNFFGSGFKFPDISFAPVLGNLPDPYTGAKPTQETGMPAGAMWKNQWGEGYAYDFKNTIITPTGYIPSPSLLNPIRQQQAIASAKAEDWEGLGLSVASTPILMSRAPIMSVAPIMSAATSDRGMTPTQPTQAQVKAAQQAYIDARTHLGTPIGTAARNYDFQNPNSIIQTPGGIQVTDERGVVVTDTSAIINQSDKARREAEILKSSTKSY